MLPILILVFEGVLKKSFFFLPLAFERGLNLKNLKSKRQAIAL
jgi:hypothetical protein